MCSVYSAVSGEVIAVVDEYDGKTAKEIKQFLAAQLGVTRFRQRFFSEDGSREIKDDDVFASEQVKIQLVLLEFLPPDGQEDQKMIAAARENDSKVLEKLLLEPRSPNVADEGGWTPLHLAADYGHVGPMRLLLEAGAARDARHREYLGLTPLVCSAYNGHLESVGLLLQAGADGDLATLNWATHIAAGGGHVRIVRALLEARADPNQSRTGHGSTPLRFAARKGHVGVVLALIEARADLNLAPETNGVTPLLVAAANGHVEVVRALIEAGADLNHAAQTSGATPLVAAANGHVEIVRLLQQKAQQMRSPLPALPLAGPQVYTWRPVPATRVVTVMPVPVTAAAAMTTFVPGATDAPATAAESNPRGSTSSRAKDAVAPRCRQKSCC